MADTGNPWDDYKSPTPPSAGEPWKDFSSPKPVTEKEKAESFKEMLKARHENQRAMMEGWSESFQEGGKGLVQAVTHPIQTASGIFEAVSHPVETAGSIIQSVAKTSTNLLTAATTPTSKLTKEQAKEVGKSIGGVTQMAIGGIDSAKVAGTVKDYVSASYNAERLALEAKRVQDVKDAAESLRNSKHVGVTDAEYAQRTNAIKEQFAKEKAELEKQRTEGISKIQEKGKKELASKKAELAVAEQPVVEVDQLKERTASSRISGLPAPYSLANGRLTAGDLAREYAKPALQKAKKEQLIVGDAWKNSERIAKSKQQENQFFETSEKGKKLIIDLKKIAEGGIEKDVSTAGPLLQKYAQQALNSIKGVDKKIVSINAEGKQVVSIEHYPVNFQVAHESVRRLRDIQYSHPSVGYGEAAKRAARNIANEVEDALAAYVGEENYPKGLYREGSKSINLWQSKLGQAISGTEEIPYIGKEEAPHLMTSDRIAKEMFTSPDSVSMTARLLGQEQMTQVAEHYVSDVLARQKDVNVWLNDPKNSWIREVPGLQEKVERYALTTVRQKGEFAATQKQISRLQKVIAEYPEKIDARIERLNNRFNKRLKDLQNQSVDFYTEALTARTETDALADEVTSWLRSKNPDEVAKAANEAMKKMKRLPGVDQKQIDAVKKAGESAEARIRDAATYEAKKAQQDAFIKYIRYLVATTVGVQSVDKLIQKANP